MTTTGKGKAKSISYRWRLGFHNDSWRRRRSSDLCCENAFFQDSWGRGFEEITPRVTELSRKENRWEVAHSYRHSCSCLLVFCFEIQFSDKFCFEEEHVLPFARICPSLLDVHRIFLFIYFYLKGPFRMAPGVPSAGVDVLGVGNMLDSRYPILLNNWIRKTPIYLILL